MTRNTAFIIAVAGGAIAFVLLRELPLAARLWASLLLAPIPVAATRQLAHIGDPESLPRIPLYLSSLVSLWMLAGVTALVAWLSGIGLADLGVVARPWAGTLLRAAGLTAIGVALIAAARAIGIRESPLLRRLLPETSREKAVFAALSVTAGSCEELVFRGFLLHVLWSVSGSAVLAVGLNAAVFGWMHAYQEPAGAVRAALLGILLSVPVVTGGSILPSVVAHAAIDVIGGILLPRRLARAMA